jgi:hypothetical protein
MTTVHDFLVQTKLPWDVARIIKSFVGQTQPPPRDVDEISLDDISLNELVKFRSRHKKRAFTF